MKPGPKNHRKALPLLRRFVPPLAALLLAACSRQEHSARSTPRTAPPVPVVTAQASVTNLPVDVSGIGSVQAYSLVAIRPQITGPILQVHFEEGQEVQQGDLLFTIDARPFEAALNQAQANLKRDEAQMLSARLEFLRTSNLFENRIASRADYDTAEAVYRAHEATVLADHAAISNAQVSLGYTAIRSPISGRTGAVAIKQGNVVKALDDILVTISQIEPVYVAFSVTEEHLPAIRREARQRTLPVYARAPGGLEPPARGELTFINNVVDTNTGMILLKGTFPNNDHALWPGQFVQATLIVSNLVQATVVPSQAVQTGQDGEYLFAVGPDLKVEARPVTTGVSRDGWTAILNGVTPGETVVTDGQLNLVSGRTVSVKAPPPAEANRERTAPQS